MIGDALFCTFESRSVNPFDMFIGVVTVVDVGVLKPPLFSRSPTTFAAFDMFIVSGFEFEFES